jgi:hypothetical protein
VPVTDFAVSPIRHRRRRDVPLVVGATLVAVILYALVASQLREPDRVDRLTLVNPTDYGLRVTVRASALDGAFDLGWVWDRSEVAIVDAPDVGDTWIFRFSYAGRDAGELVVARDELVREGWRLTIPPGAAERLAAAGLVPAYHDQSPVPVG